MGAPDLRVKDSGAVGELASAPTDKREEAKPWEMDWSRFLAYLFDRQVSPRMALIYAANNRDLDAKVIFDFNTLSKEVIAYIIDFDRLIFYLKNGLMIIFAPTSSTKMIPPRVQVYFNHLVAPEVIE